MTKFTKLALALTASSYPVAARAITWDTLAETLPNPVSDMTATLIPGQKNMDDDVIFIAGGCSSENGNENSDGMFSCREVTNETYSFNVNTKIFTKMTDMPEARYRHAAVAIYGKLYIVGGRDVNDTLIRAIIVYDPVTNDWSQVRILPDKYLVSDNAALTYEGKLYVLGGYGVGYNAQTFMIQLDLETQGITEKKPMITARGDANAVTYRFADETTVAYIMGGFTHENDFCAPLADAEMYNFLTDEWTDIEDMNFKRGDKAVVVHNGRILAIGGEGKHEEKCENTESRALGEEGSGSILIDDIEYYDPREKDAAWTFGNKLDEHRFRAAAVSVKSTGSVYVFGGQSLYSTECDCYPTSDTIFEYKEEITYEGEILSSSQAVRSSTFGLFFVSLFSVTAMFMAV
mmetsp:Transcript_6130/g.7132  ORF Transcript_6130/g.7132 Transcript_6130/m.7132 type:complete len:404 (-) Transcript_6130:153-1364(-)|eukprot:CAMPEP_0198255458 /NCGR_PEP_ID=MMETSP1447-20131203/5572_1 /TAXON_ID=420782 /ORGANISM="Chaetoceros dichaeta, Strain CCMP1751" /LENGTH=403 /DNA_ID=CAMNT_0043941825 /DNA_START=73 /DNA_END=1284 /DNA_ORIENTATION=+